MRRLCWTSQAEEDLAEIWLYVAEKNSSAADDLVDRIERACRRLTRHPKLGPARPDLAPDLRYTVESRYLILYRELSNAVEIVRVLHGARHLRLFF